MRTIFNCFDTYYKSPFGAVERLTPITFRLNIPHYVNAVESSIIMFRPGYKEKVKMLENKGVQEENGEKFTLFEGVYTPEHTGLHHYYFAVTDNGGRKYLKRVGASEARPNEGELFQLTVYDEGMTTPDWIKGGIMYQIFPDRFAKSVSAADDIMTPVDRQMHANWNDIPSWQPNEKGMITNSDYYGGNLRGIEEKLPYLKSLGVTCIYLNPIFEAHENHRYNTANYERIDILLGKEEDFRRLCKAADEIGIKIILDGVFSHTGADSIYFNKFGRYGENTGAFRDPESPYRSWYSFINYPHEYESWWGITTLPNVNENNPEYTNYICGEGGILQRWIDAGAAGWRLDVADELPDEFLDNLRIAVKAKGEDKIIYGEVWEDASNKESYGVRRRYLIGGQLDSVMNYPFKECILNYAKYGDYRQLVDGVMTIIEHYPKPSVDVLMNFLSTHDTERAITRLAGQEVGWNDRKWQSENSLSPQEYAYGVALMKCAMVLQFFLPGVPCIYYADEAGQEGYKDPFNRRTYPWGNEDGSLVSFVAELGRLRRSSEVFAKGTMRFISADEQSCVFRREDSEKGIAAVIYLNRSPKAKKFSLQDTVGDCLSFEVMRHGHRDKGQIQLSPFDYEIVFLKL